MPNHYKDIIEERAISKQCGYPVCKNRMEKVRGYEQSDTFIRYCSPVARIS